jgi:DNA polymerase-3 subunit delta
VLIICHKGGNLDRRKKLPALIEKNGVLFESKPLRDERIPGFVASYLKRKGLTIELEAASMVADLVGTKLTKVVNELEKLCVGMPKGQTMVTKDQVLATIGVSRDFNIFELQDALAKKDVSHATRIARTMAKDEREFYLPATLTMLFRFFSQLMLAYYAPEKTPAGIANWLGLREWQVTRNVMPAMKSYSGVKVMNIISKIRETDARCKGIENGGATSAELFSELIYFILH